MGKIKPILDFEIVIKNGLYPINSLVLLYLMNDFDLTLTSEDSLTAFEEFYYNQLPKSNKRIEEKSQEIKKCIKGIESSPQDFSKPHAKLDKILRECELEEEQFIEACVETGRSKNIKIVPYATEVMMDLEKMNCCVGINSGSPKLAIEEISRRKIGIKNSNIAGSEFFFDKNGHFLSSWLNLGENKVKSMSTYFLPKAYCDFSFLTDFNKPSLVYVTDDLSPFDQPIVAKVGSMLGTTFFVGKGFEKHERSYEYVMNVPELREDFRKIKPYLNLYKRAKIFPFLHKPEEAEEIIKLAEEIKFSNYEDFEDLLNKIQDFLHLEVLFPSLTTRMKEKCEELRRKLNAKALKKEELEEVVGIMKAFDPAFHVKEKRREELKEIILSSVSS